LVRVVDQRAHYKLGHCDIIILWKFRSMVHDFEAVKAILTQL
jgi:hypothetical protein